MQNLTNRNLRDPNKFRSWNQKIRFFIENFLMQVHPEAYPSGIYIT